MKTLYIGNESQDTDDRTLVEANKNNTINHGLISDPNFIPKDEGYYHTSVLDLTVKDIINIANHVNSIILHDQDINEWSDFNIFVATYKLFQNLSNLGFNVEYKNNQNIKQYENNELLAIPTFCIHPWISLTNSFSEVRLCPRIDKTFQFENGLSDWKTNTDLVQIRKQLLNGERIPECKRCYEYEDAGIESYRQFETNEWLGRLNITKQADLDNIDHPFIFEMKINNKCNIMCRSCSPLFSHKIEKEYKIHNLVNLTHIPKASNTVATFDHINIDKLTPDSMIHLSGGEPPIIKDVYKFLQRCIDKNNTDFYLAFGSNGTVFPDKFIDLIKHFPKTHITFSLDGYGKINDYWRWGSDFDTIIKNMHIIKELGCNISVNTVPGIYNVTNLHLLWEFLDKEFPDVEVYTQLNFVKSQSAWNHPDKALVVESMQKCKQANIYYNNGKSTKTSIDMLLEHYSNDDTEYDIASLNEFFTLNDKLDEIRNVKLIDYIPELDKCRSLTNNGSLVK